jgi:hypothetical protein
MLIFRRSIVFLQHLVSSLSVSDRAVHRLREDCSPLSTGARYINVNNNKYNFDKTKLEGISWPIRDLKRKRGRDLEEAKRDEKIR